MRRRTGPGWKIGLLAICAAIVAGCSAMWWRSTTTEDRISLAIANRRIYLGSVSQRFYIRGMLSGEDRLHFESHPARQAHAPAESARLWPVYQKELLAQTVFVPYWMAMALPGIWLIFQLKGRAARTSRSRKASHSGAGGGSSMRMARRSKSSRLRKVA